MLETQVRNPQSHPQKTQYWIKVYTKNPFCIYFWGPFKQHDDALCEKELYVTHLLNQGKEVVTDFLLQPESCLGTVNSCTLSHQDWLLEMLQDELKINIPHGDIDASQIIERHSVNDPYL